jgi:hypothetical protein
MTEEEAKRRFMILNLLRLSGLVLVFLGIANVNGKLLPALTPWLGTVMLIGGVFEFFVIPVLLRRAWRRPPQ